MGARPDKPSVALSVAARLARDASLTISVLVPPEQARLARGAAEEAGVDVYLEPRAACLAIRFVARHQDRVPPPAQPTELVLTRIGWIRTSTGGRPRLRTLARKSTERDHLKPTLPGLEYESFHHLSQALGLDSPDDAEAANIRARLTRAAPDARQAAAKASTNHADRPSRA